MTNRFSVAAWAMMAMVSAGPLTGQVDQRFDLRVPMRDRVELSANLWMPVAAAATP